MTELTLSITPTDAVEMTTLQQVLKDFEKRTHIAVWLHEIDTKVAREEISHFADHVKGPDVSQVGSTWLHGIVDMNALRPFKTHEVEQIGNPADFIEASWKSTFLSGQPNVQWAIPWLADVRMIYYRRDLLEKAGIDEKGAFATPEIFEQTLQQLQASGIANPWVVPTQHSWRTLHNLASWIWGFGGDFLDASGKKVLFANPEALAGIKAYFSLGRYLTDAARGLTTSQADVLFMKGQAAVTISGSHLLAMPPDLLEQVGFTSPPGPPFVGGSHLVVWKYTRFEKEAVELVRTLASAEVQKTYGQGSLLPVRLDALAALENEAGHEGVFARYVQQTLANGRSFPSAYLWDIIEARLAAAMVSIWGEVLQAPVPDLEAIFQRTLPVLAHRLNVILNND